MFCFGFAFLIYLQSLQYCLKHQCKPNCKNWCMVNVVIHSSTCFIARLTSVILQMNVATTYQLKKMVIVQNFKNLMFKAMCNSLQHLYSRKTKLHIQGLLQSSKGRRYKKHFKVVFQSLIFSIHNLVLMDLWFWY